MEIPAKFLGGISGELSAEEVDPYINKLLGSDGEELNLDHEEDWVVDRLLHHSITDVWQTRINKIVRDNNLRDVAGETSCRGNIKQFCLYENEEHQPNVSETLKLLDDDIINFVKLQIKDITIKNKIIDYDYDLEMTYAWTCIGQKGSFHVPHTHSRDYPTDVLSTTIYLQTKPLPKDEIDSGLFYYIWRDDRSKIEYIEPEDGMMLLFPNWLAHGTIPQHAGKRQTFNLSFKVVKK